MRKKQDNLEKEARKKCIKFNVKVDPVFMEPHVVIEDDYGGIYSTLLTDASIAVCQ